MRLAFLPLVAVIATIACTKTETPAPQKPGSGPAPTGRQAGPREPETVIKVLVVVDSLDSLQKRCTGNEFQPFDILIESDPAKNEPRHCIDGIPMLHHDVHAKYPNPPDNRAMVQVHRNQGQSVVWYSDNTEFAIVGIEVPHPKDQPQPPGPTNPFPKLSIPTPLSKNIPSGPLDEFFAKQGSDHLYKMLLRIGQNRNIDPDVWCQP